MDTSQFKGANGAQLTQALFYEFQNPDAPYTLRDEDFTNRKGVTYPSAAAIYRNSVDEYDAAMNLVGSWSHWQKLISLDWFLNGSDLGGYIFRGVKQWREEMALRDASLSKKQLMEAAELGSVPAQRYLNESSGKSTTKAGRPEVKKPTKTVPSAVAQFQKIQGGKT